MTMLFALQNRLIVKCATSTMAWTRAANKLSAALEGIGGTKDNMAIVAKGLSGLNAELADYEATKAAMEMADGTSGYSSATDPGAGGFTDAQYNALVQLIADTNQAITDFAATERQLEIDLGLQEQDQAQTEIDSANAKAELDASNGLLQSVKKMIQEYIKRVFSGQ